MGFYILLKTVALIRKRACVCVSVHVSVCLHVLVRTNGGL